MQRISRFERGIALTSLMIALLISTFLAALAAGKMATIVNEAAAESTGRYLLTVRGAVLSAVSAHQAALEGHDVSALPPGTVATPPAWALFAGDSTVISVADLKDAGFLRTDFPATPPLGRSVHVSIQRPTALCPGPTCLVDAFVYTCWPITIAKPTSLGDLETCSSAPSGVEFNQNLLGSAILASEGYGGSNLLDRTQVRGPLINIESARLGIPSTSQGNLVINASLNSTIHNQFVRQGDTRNIRLFGTLGVEGALNAEGGLQISAQAEPGGVCTEEGMIVTSANKTLLTCMGGRWFEANTYSVKSVNTLRHNDAVPPVTCPPGSERFVTAAVSVIDVTMTGTDVTVIGGLTGSMSGSGYTSETGAVSVSGSFTGTTTSTEASRIRVAQTASIVGNNLVISPESPNARAEVTQGCRFLD